jgi:rRNA methylases
MAVPGQTTQVITSARNPLLKDVRRAVAKGGLTEDGYAIAETFHLLDEAIRSGCEIKAVLASESAQAAVTRHLPPSRSLRLVVVADEVFGQIAATENSQGVITLVRPPSWTMQDLFRLRPLVVLLDGVQDPGNGGAIIRAAEAFGATGVVLLKGTVSPWNPKALRASAGSSFRLPLVSGVDSSLAQKTLEQRGVEAYAAMPHGDIVLSGADLKAPCAFVIGSEGRGVSEVWRRSARGLRIPTSGVESLNAAMAAGILLYEARRQRGTEA